MYVAAALELRDGDRGRLEALTRASTVSAGLATRARIVLLAADGVANTEIAIGPPRRGRQCSSGGAAMSSRESTGSTMILVRDAPR